MKNLLITLSILFSAGAFALEIDGTYEVTRPMHMGGYKKAACVADKGVYIGDGICRFENGAGTTLEIKSTQRNFAIEISKVGTNAHTCDFSGYASLTGNIILTSKQNGDHDQCDLAIKFTGKDTVSIETNGECNEYCGAGMTLDEEVLTRK